MFLTASTIIFAMLVDQLFNEGKLELHLFKLQFTIKYTTIILYINNLKYLGNNSQLVILLNNTWIRI